MDGESITFDESSNYCIIHTAQRPIDADLHMNLFATSQNISDSMRNGILK